MLTRREDRFGYVRLEDGSDVPFVPQVHYDRDGNCIEAVFTSESFYADYVSAKLTVYRSQRTGEIVGVFIPAAKQLVGA
jgi:hypothetical protein